MGENLNYITYREKAALSFRAFEILFYMTDMFHSKKCYFLFYSILDNYVFYLNLTLYTIQLPNIGLMLYRRLRCWSSIKPTCRVFVSCLLGDIVVSGLKGRICLRYGPLISAGRCIVFNHEGYRCLSISAHILQPIVGPISRSPTQNNSIIEPPLYARSMPVILSKSNKRVAFTQCWFNAGPPSQTVDQH